MNNYAQRKGVCTRCGYPKCGWFQKHEPCQRSSTQIAEWRRPPEGCKRCGEAGPMSLGEGKGPHAASWVCPSCGAWSAWVARWRLDLVLKNRAAP